MSHSISTTVCVSLYNSKCVCPSENHQKIVNYFYISKCVSPFLYQQLRVSFCITTNVCVLLYFDICVCPVYQQICVSSLYQLVCVPLYFSKYLCPPEPQILCLPLFISNCVFPSVEQKLSVSNFISANKCVPLYMRKFFSLSVHH